jgi:hypothetical protein
MRIVDAAEPPEPCRPRASTPTPIEDAQHGIRQVKLDGHQSKCPDPLGEPHVSDAASAIFNRAGQPPSGLGGHPGSVIA